MAQYTTLSHVSGSNNLRILREGLKEEPLTLKQRDDLIAALEANRKRTFTQIRALIGKNVQFNLEDPKRQELNGNATSAKLSEDKYFGTAWFKLDEAKQDAIVLQLVKEENEAKLVRWLQVETGIDEKRAEAIANVGLPEGYDSLCAQALARILPELRRDAVTYDKAVQGRTSRRLRPSQPHQPLGHGRDFVGATLLR